MCALTAVHIASPRHPGATAARQSILNILYFDSRALVKAFSVVPRVKVIGLNLNHVVWKSARVPVPKGESYVLGRAKQMAMLHEGDVEWSVQGFIRCLPAQWQPKVLVPSNCQAHHVHVVQRIAMLLHGSQEVKLLNNAFVEPAWL